MASSEYLSAPLVRCFLWELLSHSAVEEILDLTHSPVQEILELSHSPVEEIFACCGIQSLFTMTTEAL